MSHNYQDLITLFNNLFEFSENTVLISHGTEPLYLPQDENHSKSRIIFTNDYYSSALHEIAHWCIASCERRKLIDYGYWYNPHRVTTADQQLFEQAEAKPQALEWIFSIAAGIKFNISADNLLQNNVVSQTFKVAIYNQTVKYLSEGLPERAERFKQHLLNFYQRTQIFDMALFSLT